MSELTVYLRFLKYMEKSNKAYDLDGVDVLLLDFIAKASHNKKLLYVKNLLPLKEIASPATIHARLKKLVAKKLISLNPDPVDGRYKEVLLAEKAYRRYKMLSNAIEQQRNTVN